MHGLDPGVYLKQQLNTKEGRTMKTIPRQCEDINEVSSFCGCIADEDAVDEAARAFCRKASAGGAPYVTGDDLAELKKALIDMED